MPKSLVEKALKSAGWDKDGTPIPITQEHIDTALREMRESLERSLAREHDRETGLRPLEIDGKKVRGAYVYRGDETNYTGPKENPPEPGTIYVHAVRVHSVELEPAENGEHRPTTKAPITLAKEILGQHLPTSSYVSYRLNPAQDWKIRVSGQEITANDVRALLAKDGIAMKKALSTGDNTAHDSLLWADGELVPGEDGVIDLGDIMEGKPMEKGQRAPAGFTPIPNSKHGGWHKRVGNGWESWYPDGRHQTRHAHISVGKEHVYIHEPGDKYKRKMPRADYDRHQAEHQGKAGGLSVAPEASPKTGKYWSKTQVKDGAEYRDHKGRPVGEKKRGFWQRLLGKGTWVPMASKLGEFAWGASLAKGGALITPRGAEVVEMRSELARLFVGPALWKAGSRGPFLKKVPTGKYRTKKDGSQGAQIYRYFYRVQHGGGVHNAEHFKEGASFAHGAGHYTIHGVKDGKLHVSHSSGGKKVKMTHDELAAKLSEHHKGALDAHKAKLTREHGEAVAAGNHKGAEKIRAEAAKVGHKIEAPADKPKKSKVEKPKADKRTGQIHEHWSDEDIRQADEATKAHPRAVHPKDMGPGHEASHVVWTKRPGLPWMINRSRGNFPPGMLGTKRGPYGDATIAAFKPGDDPNEPSAKTEKPQAAQSPAPSKRSADADFAYAALTDPKHDSHDSAWGANAIGDHDNQIAIAQKEQKRRPGTPYASEDRELETLHRGIKELKARGEMPQKPKADVDRDESVKTHAAKQADKPEPKAVESAQKPDRPGTLKQDSAGRTPPLRERPATAQAMWPSSSPKPDRLPPLREAPEVERKPEATPAPSHADRVAEAKERYGLKGKEHDRLDAHEHTKKAAELHAAGDHDKAARYLREAVKDVLYKNPERNMSPSTAESHMKQREAKTPKAKMTKALRAFVTLWKGSLKA